MRIHAGEWLGDWGFGVLMFAWLTIIPIACLFARIQMKSDLQHSIALRRINAKLVSDGRANALLKTISREFRIETPALYVSDSRQFYFQCEYLAGSARFGERGIFIFSSAAIATLDDTDLAMVVAHEVMHLLRDRARSSQEHLFVDKDVAHAYGSQKTVASLEAVAAHAINSAAYERDIEYREKADRFLAEIASRIAHIK